MEPTINKPNLSTLIKNNKTIFISAICTVLILLVLLIIFLVSSGNNNSSNAILTTTNTLSPTSTSISPSVTVDISMSPSVTTIYTGTTTPTQTFAPTFTVSPTPAIKTVNNSYYKYTYSEEDVHKTSPADNTYTSSVCSQPGIYDTYTMNLSPYTYNVKIYFCDTNETDLNTLAQKTEFYKAGNALTSITGFGNTDGRESGYTDSTTGKNGAMHIFLKNHKMILFTVTETNGFPINLLKTEYIGGITLNF